MSTAHEFIRFALAQDVLRFGEFKTKAGRLSPYFFNAGLFYDGTSLAQLANGYAGPGGNSRECIATTDNIGRSE